MDSISLTCKTSYIFHKESLDYIWCFTLPECTGEWVGSMRNQKHRANKHVGVHFLNYPLPLKVTRC